MRNGGHVIRKKIAAVQGKSRAQVDPNDRYLAHYFSQLMDVTADLEAKEGDIRSFVDACNSYLYPSKHMIYDEHDFTVTLIDNDFDSLDLSVLSSGEKQIISTLAHLYLENFDDQLVVIDEPELSLSVVWQRSFLSSIRFSGRCGFLMAVTHSPFIYENDLQSHAVDLRRAVT